MTSVPLALGCHWPTVPTQQPVYAYSSLHRESTNRGRWLKSTLCLPHRPFSFWEMRDAACGSKWEWDRERVHGCMHVDATGPRFRRSSPSMLILHCTGRAQIVGVGLNRRCVCHTDHFPSGKCVMLLVVASGSGIERGYTDACMGMRSPVNHKPNMEGGHSLIPRSKMNTHTFFPL